MSDRPTKNDIGREVDVVFSSDGFCVYRDKLVVSDEESTPTEQVLMLKKCGRLFDGAYKWRFTGEKDYRLGDSFDLGLNALKKPTA